MVNEADRTLLSKSFLWWGGEGEGHFENPFESFRLPEKCTSLRICICNILPTFRGLRKGWREFLSHVNCLLQPHLAIATPRTPSD